MPLFKRKDKTTIAELEEYYSNQNKNSSGRAWFMALLSLLITLAVLAALFFGGRWLYRLVTNDDAVSVTTSTGQSEQEGGVPAFGEIRTDSDSDNTSDSDTNEASEDGSSEDSATNATNSSEGVVSDEAASTTRDVAGTDTDSESSGTTDTIVATTEIPNTGANELIALIPLLTLVTGYFYSRNRQLNK